MKILTAEQFRQADIHTIENEPVLSTDLMERAANSCVEWILENFAANNHFTVFCGTGNNGGDGLVITRYLSLAGKNVECYVLRLDNNPSPDFLINEKRLRETDVPIHDVTEFNDFPLIKSDSIIIDALFGTGLSRPLRGIAGNLVDYINLSGNKIIAIDVPSGMFCEDNEGKKSIIKATHTLTFEGPKLSFLLADEGESVGEFHVLPIGLSKEFIDSCQTSFEFIEYSQIKEIFRRRSRFAHKGSFGHLCIISGSYGKIGACVLCAKGALRSGSGLTTLYSPICGYEVLQSSVPEAMVISSTSENYISGFPDPAKFNVIAIGPGIGTHAETAESLIKAIDSNLPLVLDADALNIISEKKELLTKLNNNCVLTPHPKEFDRLFGSSNNHFSRLLLLREKAMEYNITIVLKGAYTAIALEDGKVFFNSTGNAGMAKGGSGDVLTGIIAALLTSGYTSKDSAILGVWIHGKSADIAVTEYAEESLLASDICNKIGLAFSSLY